ncbi:ABC transporter permease subunit [Paenibacillus sp. HB172176]|uniref:ABC transporter permease n=1 Tax=Paenibacillus sp. HB172176 TaxID=2493690 RepID=UPI001F0D59B8|nr:ABC transporter permease subunit [Paenibacillus sp. HB172176]
MITKATASPPMIAPAAATKRRSSLRRYWPLYSMLIPGFLYLLIFKYVPLLGSVIAFQDYNIFKGFLSSEWVGLRWFDQLFHYPQFTRLIRNTLFISFYQILFAFPAPIILACLLNEIRQMAVKRSIQTIVYMPHFLSWTIIYGLAYIMLSPQVGLVNTLLGQFGVDPIHFLQKSEFFRTIVITSGMWKEMGWSAIIFLAALAGINPSLYEAAKIDGAGRWGQFTHITLPGLVPAITILLLLKIGDVMDTGFEQIYIFLTPISYEVGDVLDTFAYRAGIVNGKYSLTTAIGLFKSVIGFLLIVISNQISKKTTGESLY